jgi:hypothetical protein
MPTTIAVVLTIPMDRLSKPTVYLKQFHTSFWNRGRKEDGG